MDQPDIQDFVVYAKTKSCEGIETASTYLMISDAVEILSSSAPLVV
jgi:hypothetical protein